MADGITDGGAPSADAPSAPERHFLHSEDVEGKLDPESLPDYVAPAATAEATSVEELQDPEWLKQLQDELDALEVNMLEVPFEVHEIFATWKSHMSMPRIYALSMSFFLRRHSVLPDDQFLQRHNVREAFMDCSDRARQRNANRKMTSLKALSTNDGRSVTYSRSARAKLNPALILRIRCVRAWLPVQLHEHRLVIYNDTAADRNGIAVLSL